MTRVFQIDMQTALEHSFWNYNARGLHYLCLRRTDRLTEKLYFIEDGAGTPDGLVVPHDHRYDFTSTTLAGVCENLLFAERPDGEIYHRVKYETPLNGGQGFRYDRPSRLKLVHRTPYRRGDWFKERAEEVHTIRPEGGTILHQRQYEDRVSGPTLAYSPTRALPNLSGLYESFDEDKVFACARQLIAAGYGVEILPE